MADTVLARLASARLDPVDYLNEVLPSLNLSAQGPGSKVSRTSQLQSASTDIQALLSKINTHSVRSSTELASLTDEILRSGSRLAYEVEILRGDVNNFYDILTDALKEDIQNFVREELAQPEEGNDDEASQPACKRQEPAFIAQLQRLSQVKARLEAVIGLFGEAMKWPVPPSELSSANVLISVSAPELGMQTTEEDDKAREAQKKIRVEIQDLLDSDGGGAAGLEAATKRLEEYKQLASIWKGTSEERARTRFVDGLSRLVEDRARNVEARELSQRSKTGSPHRSSSQQGRPARQDGGGLFRGLARLKDELYLE
jgi:hypothetical protein